MSEQLARNLINRTNDMEALPSTFNVAGAYFDLVKRLCNNYIKQKSRIAELEAEVERLKAQDEMTYPEALKALNEMADFIKQQSATDFEEGEG